MDVMREIGHDGWAEYFDWLSREMINAPVSIEIVGPGGPGHVQVENLALQALSYDRRDDVFEVAVARDGARLPSTLRHLVTHPKRVVVDSELLLAPLEIAVDDADGIRTLISIAREPDLAG